MTVVIKKSADHGSILVASVPAPATAGGKQRGATGRPTPVNVPNGKTGIETAGRYSAHRHDRLRSFSRSRALRHCSARSVNFFNGNGLDRKSTRLNSSH